MKVTIHGGILPVRDKLLFVPIESLQCLLDVIYSQDSARSADARTAMHHDLVLAVVALAPLVVFPHVVKDLAYYLVIRLVRRPVIRPCHVLKLHYYSFFFGSLCIW